MKNCSVSRALAIDDNGAPILIPFSALSASIDFGRKELVISMDLSDGDPFIFARHKLDDASGLVACFEIIGSKEEINFASTLGKLAVTAVATGLIAKGAHHLAGGANHRHEIGNSGLYEDTSTQASAGIGTVGAGSALLHLGHTGPDMQNIHKVRLLLEDGTDVLFEMNDAEIEQLRNCERVTSGEGPEEYFLERFREIAARLADGERSFPELDRDIEQINDQAIILTKRLEQGATYEERDRTRTELSEAQQLGYGKQLLKITLGYLLAYEKADKNGKFELFERLKAEEARRSDLKVSRRLLKAGVWVGTFIIFIVCASNSGKPFFPEALVLWGPVIFCFIGLRLINSHFKGLAASLPKPTEAPPEASLPPPQLAPEAPQPINAPPQVAVAPPPKLVQEPPQLAPEAPQRINAPQQFAVAPPPKLVQESPQLAPEAPQPINAPPQVAVAPPPKLVQEPPQLAPELPQPIKAPPPQPVAVEAQIAIAEASSPVGRSISKFALGAVGVVVVAIGIPITIVVIRETNVFRETAPVPEAVAPKAVAVAPIIETTNATTQMAEAKPKDGMTESLPITTGNEGVSSNPSATTSTPKTNASDLPLASAQTSGVEEQRLLKQREYERISTERRDAEQRASAEKETAQQVAKSGVAETIGMRDGQSVATKSTSGNPPPLEPVIPVVSSKTVDPKFQLMVATLKRLPSGSDITFDDVFLSLFPVSDGDLKGKLRQYGNFMHRMAYRSSVAWSIEPDGHIARGHAWGFRDQESADDRAILECQKKQIMKDPRAKCQVFYRSRTFDPLVLSNLVEAARGPDFSSWEKGAVRSFELIGK